jgi:hypothetical protein
MLVLGLLLYTTKLLLSHLQQASDHWGCYAEAIQHAGKQDTFDSRRRENLAGLSAQTVK